MIETYSKSLWILLYNWIFYILASCWGSCWYDCYSFSWKLRFIHSLACEVKMHQIKNKAMVLPLYIPFGRTFIFKGFFVSEFQSISLFTSTKKDSDFFNFKAWGKHRAHIRIYLFPLIEFNILLLWGQHRQKLGILCPCF